jgi:hypothetical protein
MYNGAGGTIYYKVTNILPIQSYESVYILMARAGETIIIGCGHGDGSAVQTPRVKRLLNTYSKIGGLAYKDRDLYVQIAGYSHEVILTRLCGNYLNSNIVTSRITATEYESATAITIDS